MRGVIPASSGEFRSRLECCSKEKSTESQSLVPTVYQSMVTGDLHDQVDALGAVWHGCPVERETTFKVSLVCRGSIQ